MRIRTVAIAAGILLSVNADAQWLPDPATGPIYYNGGNVGIGTDSPGALLHVVGNGTGLGVFLENFNKDINLGVGVLSVVDRTLPTAQSWTVGGNISLRGVYNASTGATAGFGGIKAGKTNATDGNLDSFLALYTRGHATGITEKVRIDESGRVGIGTTAPGALLDVNGTARVSGDLIVNGNFTSPTAGSFSVGGTAPSGYPFFATNATAGTGTAVQLHSNYATHATSFFGNFGMYGTHLSQNRNPQNGAFTDAAAAPNQTNAVDLAIGDTSPGRNRLLSLANYPGGVETPRVVVKYNGYVGIGTADPTEQLHVVGNINVTGNINAKYQDIAEWVPSSDDLEPGTVVVLDAALGNGVMASTTAYDTKVAGVVSAQPGITLGESGASKEQVATTGRVRVKVDASPARIAVGDLLVTSDRPGYAMRSIPVEMAGIAMHRPGTIVGKALEPLVSGEGEILVLLSLQ